MESSIFRPANIATPTCDPVPQDELLFASSDASSSSWQNPTESILSFNQPVYRSIITGGDSGHTSNFGFSTTESHVGLDSHGTPFHFSDDLSSGIAWKNHGLSDSLSSGQQLWASDSSSAGGVQWKPASTAPLDMSSLLPAKHLYADSASSSTPLSPSLQPVAASSSSSSSSSSPAEGKLEELVLPPVCSSTQDCKAGHPPSPPEYVERSSSFWCSESASSGRLLPALLHALKALDPKPDCVALTSSHSIQARCYQGPRACDVLIQVYEKQGKGGADVSGSGSDKGGALVECRRLDGCCLVFYACYRGLLDHLPGDLRAGCSPYDDSLSAVCFTPSPAPTPTTAIAGSSPHESGGAGPCALSTTSLDAYSARALLAIALPHAHGQLLAGSSGSDSDSEACEQAPRPKEALTALSSLCADAGNRAVLLAMVHQHSGTQSHSQSQSQSQSRQEEADSESPEEVPSECLLLSALAANLTSQDASLRHACACLLARLLLPCAAVSACRDKMLPLLAPAAACLSQCAAKDGGSVTGQDQWSAAQAAETQKQLLRALSTLLSCKSAGKHVTPRSRQQLLDALSRCACSGDREVCQSAGTLHDKLETANL